MSEEEQSFSKGFIDQFDAYGTTFVIQVKHYLSLNGEERQRHNVEDGEFLVHLFNQSDCKTFKVFLDDNLNWSSNTSELFVDQEFIAIIGSIIDEYTYLNKW